jgi:retinol dehydrogenase 14
VVTVSSNAQAMRRIDFDDLQGERDHSGARAYNQSKLANVLFTYELARRLGATGVTANCLHPGVVATKLMADYMNVPLVGGAIARTFGGSVEKGAETSLYLAASPEVEGLTGRYFVGQRETRSSPASYDGALQQRLWEESARLTALATASAP